jgi:glycosyltransferase involved in cell wall biosynthesis
MAVPAFSQALALRSELQCDLHEVMRWFTCTPVEFGGGADFFARDSGLLCRGFLSLGIESRAVMPGEPREGDEGDLIRTEFANLESAAWWKSLGLDGVVLYAWGSPKFRKVAGAIREAGVFLVLNQDNGGLVSPLAGFTPWLREQWILAGQGRDAVSYLRALKLVLKGLSVGLILTDPIRAIHLGHGNVIACVSPIAADHYRKLCRIYGGGDLASRVAVIPHAVEPDFRYTGGPKRHQVVCIGRWQDATQKRPWLMMETLGLLAELDDTVEITIAGTTSPALEAWHRGLKASQQSRVHLRGFLKREELAELLRESRVFYSPSAFESFGIAAAEALCCGCSVVAGRSVSMASFEWFVSEDSGCLAVTDDARGHLQALQQELASWDQGARNAALISSTWGRLLHAGEVAARVLALRSPIG